MYVLGFGDSGQKDVFPIPRKHSVWWKRQNSKTEYQAIQAIRKMAAEFWDIERTFLEEKN